MRSKKPATPAGGASSYRGYEICFPARKSKLEEQEEEEIKEKCSIVEEMNPDLVPIVVSGSALDFMGFLGVTDVSVSGVPKGVESGEAAGRHHQDSGPNRGEVGKVTYTWNEHNES